MYCFSDIAFHWACGVQAPNFLKLLISSNDDAESKESHDMLTVKMTGMDMPNRICFITGYVTLS